MRRTLNDRTPRQVYIYDAGDGVVKVGCSLHPKKRRYPLKVVYGRERMDLRFTSEFHTHAFDIEFAAHQRLREYRIGAEELFRCSVQTAKAAILAALSEINEAIARTERREAAAAERSRLNPPQHDAHVQTMRAARTAARLAREQERERARARAAEREAAMATLHAQEAVEACCKVRPYMLAAEALAAANPDAVAEAVAIWTDIKAAWRGQEAAHE